MARAFHDFSISRKERAQWRRAADELLIDAIFGTTYDMDQLVELELTARRRRQERTVAGATPDALFTPL